MNKKWLLSVLATLVCALCASSAFADFKVPPKPDNGWYVQDLSGVLTASDKDAINNKIESINKSSRNEIGVAIVSTLDGTPIFDAAQDTFHQWGIGKAGLDNGVLIFVAVQDHKMRIHTGNGAEGDLPDSVCYQIIQNTVPFFRKNDFADGILYDVDQISSKMESRVGQTPIVTPKSTQINADNAVEAAFLFFLFLVGGLFIVYLIGKAMHKHQRWERIANSYDDRYANPATNNSYYVPDPHREKKNYVPGTAVAATAIENRRKRQAKKHVVHNRPSPSYNSSSSSNSSDDSSSGFNWDSDDSGGGFGGGDSGGGGADGGW